MDFFETQCSIAVTSKPLVFFCTELSAYANLDETAMSVPGDASAGVSYL